MLYGREFEGRLVDSCGNDDLLFRFKIIDVEIDKNFMFFLCWFFVWGKNYVVYI